MSEEISENSPPNNKAAPIQPPMNAAIGRFKDKADVEKAVQALKQAGYADAEISIRNLETGEQGLDKRPAGSTTLVGVEAEGQKAAEALFILRDVGKQNGGEKGNKTPDK
jgi:hypothetical protein